MTDKKGGVYVPIYLEWLDVTQDLTAEEKGNLIDAVVSYASGLEYEPLLSGGTRIAFRFLKGQVDRNRELSAKRSKASRGVTNDDNKEQTGTNENKPEQTGTNAPKEKEKEEDKEEQKEKESKKRFAPPTLEEITAYCKERGNNLDPQYFLDYQIARNWTLSNGKKMSDWRATIRTWERNGFNRGSQAGRTVSAQNYGQRDYSGEQADAMRRMIGKIPPAQRFSQRDYSGEDYEATERMLAMGDGEEVRAVN